MLRIVAGCRPPGAHPQPSALTDRAGGGGRGGRWRWPLALLSPVLLILALEGLGRGWACASGDPYSAAATRADIQRALSALTQNVPTAGAPEDDALPPARGQSLLHPFYGFEVDVTAASTGVILDFEAAREHDDNFEVLVLGGSVAALFASENQGGGDELERVLRSDPRIGERPVFLHGAGRGGWKQPQQFIFASYALASGVRPDVILCLDGFNEVAIGLENQVAGVHPLWPKGDLWGKVTAGVEDDARVE